MVILHFKRGSQVGSEIFSPQTAQVDGTLSWCSVWESSGAWEEVRSRGGAVCSISCRIISTRRDWGYGAAESSSPASVWRDLGEGALSREGAEPCLLKGVSSRRRLTGLHCLGPGGPGLRHCWEPGFMPLLLWVQHQHLVTSSICSGAWSRGDTSGLC